MSLPALLSPLRPALAALVLAALPWSSPSAAGNPAAAPQYEINALLKDTQISGGADNDVDIVWWIPEEFWVASLQGDQSMTEKQKREFVGMLEPYTLIAVVHGKFSVVGSIAYRDEAEVRSSISLTGTDGVRYQPLAPEKTSDEARMLLQIMRPMLSNAMGKLGENMHFFLFPSKNAKGKRISDARQTGVLTVNSGMTTATYRLPLGSVLPPRYDATTGEKFPGNYQFNPYTGAKLETSSTAAPGSLAPVPAKN